MNLSLEVIMSLGNPEKINIYQNQSYVGRTIYSFPYFI